MTTSIIIFLVIVAALLAAWLGYKLAALSAENRRLTGLSEHQKKTVAAILDVALKQKELQDKLRDISEASQEELNAIYHRNLGL